MPTNHDGSRDCGLKSIVRVGKLGEDSGNLVERRHGSSSCAEHELVEEGGRKESERQLRSSCKFQGITIKFCNRLQSHV